MQRLKVQSPQLDRMDTAPTKKITKEINPISLLWKFPFPNKFDLKTKTLKTEKTMQDNREEQMDPSNVLVGLNSDNLVDPSFLPNTKEKELLKKEIAITNNKAHIGKKKDNRKKEVQPK